MMQFDEADPGTHCAYCRRDLRYCDPEDISTDEEMWSAFCDRVCRARARDAYKARRFNLHPLLMLAALLAVFMVMFITSPKRHMNLPHIQAAHRVMV